MTLPPLENFAATYTRVSGRGLSFPTVFRSCLQRNRDKPRPDTRAGTTQCGPMLSPLQQQAKLEIGMYSFGSDQMVV